MVKSKRRSSRKLSKHRRIVRIVRKGGFTNPNQLDVDPVQEFDNTYTNIPSDDNPDPELIKIFRDNKEEFIGTIDKKLDDCIQVIEDYINHAVSQNVFLKTPFDSPNNEHEFIKTAVRISKEIPVTAYKPYTQHFIGSFLEKNKHKIANAKGVMTGFKSEYADTVGKVENLNDNDRDTLWSLAFADKTLDENKLRYMTLVVYHIHDKTYKLNYLKQLAKLV